MGQGRKSAILLLLISAAWVFPVGAQTTAISPDPYDPDEFPLWARDFRRAGIIAFGSLPFTMFFSTLVMDSLRFAEHDWDRRYAPWPLKSAGAIEMNEQQRIGVFIAGISIALVVSVVDYAILRLRRDRARAAEKDIPTGEFHVERRPTP